MLVRSRFRLVCRPPRLSGWDARIVKLQCNIRISMRNLDASHRCCCLLSDASMFRSLATNHHSENSWNSNPTLSRQCSVEVAMAFHEKQSHMNDFPTSIMERSLWSQHVAALLENKHHKYRHPQWKGAEYSLEDGRQSTSVHCTEHWCSRHFTHND